MVHKQERCTSRWTLFAARTINSKSRPLLEPTPSPMQEGVKISEEG
jgi:hypothetical protein